MVVGHLISFAVSVKDEIILSNNNSCFSTPHVMITSMRKMLKTWVYFQCYTPKDMPKCVKFTHILKYILHSNCIWDVNSIMCVHQIWLDAVFPVEAFC